MYYLGLKIFARRGTTLLHCFFSDFSSAGLRAKLLAIIHGISLYVFYDNLITHP
jgi:hypothetical protein